MGQSHWHDQFLSRLIHLGNHVVKGGDEASLYPHLLEAIRVLPGSQGFALLPSWRELTSEEAAHCVQLLPDTSFSPDDPRLLKDIVRIASFGPERDEEFGTLESTVPMCWFTLRSANGFLGTLILMGSLVPPRSAELLIECIVSLLYRFQERRVASSANPLQQSRMRFKPATVLVVDDNPDNLLLLRHCLQDMGLGVVEAESGMEGLALLKDASEPLPIILLDLHMPQWNGFETLSHIREAGYKTPVVALTAYAMKEDMERCLTAGFDGYLTKPLNAVDLSLLLSRHIDSVAVDEANETGGIASTREAEEKFRPLLVSYLRRMEGSLGELDGILERRDVNGATVFAHKLRGTAASYGFAQIGKQAEEAEELLRTDGASEDQWMAAMGELGCSMRLATARFPALRAVE